MQKPFIKVTRLLFNFKVDQENNPHSMHIDEVGTIHIAAEDIMGIEEDYVSVMNKSEEVQESIAYVTHKKHTIIHVKDRKDLIDESRSFQLFAEYDYQGKKYECVEVVVAQSFKTVNKLIKQTKQKQP
jgi:hypothetical protein